MTVRELIEALRREDPDARVCVEVKGSTQTARRVERRPDGSVLVSQR